MQIKKYDKVNLEKYKILFLAVSLVIVLGLTIAVFESGSKELSTSVLGNVALEDVTEEEIDITQQEELPPEMEEPEPEPEPEAVIEQLIVVDDNKDVKDINFNTEADDKTKTSTKIITERKVVVEEEEYVAPVNFAVVEEKPSYPGGEQEMLKFIRNELKYPPIAKENGIQGRVIVEFVIDKNGKVTKIRTLKGVDPLLDKEAERVVSMMPAWTPGKQRGKAVPVTFMLPVSYKLN